MLQFVPLITELMFESPVLRNGGQYSILAIQLPEHENRWIVIARVYSLIGNKSNFIRNLILMYSLVTRLFYYDIELEAIYTQPTVVQ